MSADIETRAGALETRLVELIAKGGTLADYNGALRDAQTMIGDLRVHYAAANVLAAKNVADIGDDVIIARLMPLVRLKLREKA